MKKDLLIPLLIVFTSLTSFSADENCYKKMKLNKPSTEPAEVTISLVQYPLEGLLSLEKFKQKVEGYIKTAKTKHKADLVVFPELFIADMLDTAEKNSPLTEQFKPFVKTTTPALIEFFKTMATQHQIAVLGGSFPRERGGQIYNTALLAFKDGRLEFQEKNFLTPDEVAWNWSKSDKINVIESPFGKLAILICYDAEFPKVSSDLAKVAPEIFIVPSMTDTIEGFKRVRWTAQARAIEHRAYVIHTGTVGTPDPSWPNWGQASFLTPSEKGYPGILKEGRANKDEIVTAKLSLKSLRETRHKKGIYPACDQL